MTFDAAAFAAVFNRIADAVTLPVAIVWFTTPEAGGGPTPLEVALSDPQRVLDWFQSTRGPEGGIGQ